MNSKNIRYDRQERIQHWDQTKLTNAKVAIVGTGNLAQFTAVSLTALGVGNIEIYDNNSESSSFLIPSDDKNRASSLEVKLRKMNPDVNINGLRLEKESAPSLGNPDLVIDLTNSPKTKREVIMHALTKGIRVISASTGKTGGEMYFAKPGEEGLELRLDKYSGVEQGAFPSEIFGGMIAEEVRKALMPLKEGEAPVKGIGYHATSEKRFTKQEDFEAQPCEDISKKRVLIVGAGALGNFVALGAALEGVGNIDILDFDEVEAHNLNRQIMFYDSVGQKKSTALAEKIKQLRPDIKVRGLVGKLDEKTTYFEQHKPDVILDCVDNFATRAITNYFAVHYGIPLVSGGTNSQSGQVVVYEPGMSACLDCKLGVEKALGMALQGSKCTNAPDPSVIMTNEVIGGMMVGEALKVFDKGYGAPVSRILKYDSTVPVRGGLIGADESCGCTKGDINAWLGKLKETYSTRGAK